MGIPRKAQAVGGASAITALASAILFNFAYPPGDICPISTCFNGATFQKLVPGFSFGSGTAAYQVEGGYNIDGRGASIWDTFTHEHPDKIADRSTGQVATDDYHRHMEDITINKYMGFQTYRFSISWSRVLPVGKVPKEGGVINEKGIEYYNEVINEIIRLEMIPYVNIFHWDVPQHLEFEFGGFLSEKIVPHFRDYADLLFERFGDRVKMWGTLNEPQTFSNNGYDTGEHAPGRCTSCNYGDSGTEPYNVTQNQLLCHAHAVDVYRTKYKWQNGKIGIALSCFWMEPFSGSKNDREAAGRALDFMIGWLLNPMTYGDYPSSMKAYVGSRLPSFTKDEAKLVMGSYDFVGLNYYTARYAQDAEIVSNAPPRYSTDGGYKLTTEKDGVPIGKPTNVSWLYVYPRGIKELLVYIKDQYQNPTIYITENGVANEITPSSLSHHLLRDDLRKEFYCEHLKNVLKAISEGVDVKGYFAWSLLDNFEWAAGYTQRFGLNYVDFENDLQRWAKSSANWFKNFLTYKVTFPCFRLPGFRRQ